MSVFNSKQFDYTKQPMFFGEELGVQRYDVYKYPVFDKLTQQQYSFFWRPEKFTASLNKDRLDYQSLTPEQKHIFTSNLKYQIMLDSVQGRAPGLALLPICSLPELESCINAWQFFEGIHSRSYTHIIKNVYPDPSEVFDTILENEDILERAKSVTEAYDDFIESLDAWRSSNLSESVGENVTADETLKELKRKLYRAIISVYILEGIRFYVSFACTFAFGELKLMEGSAKIVADVMRDEFLHHTITFNILKNWKSGDDPDFLPIIKEEEAFVYQAFREVVEQEKAWARYLFKDGSMIGLNAKLLSMYVEWIANRRMKALGLKPIYDIAANNNPLPWMDHWTNSKNVQESPQEILKISYLVGAIHGDVDSDTFAGFKL